MDKDKALMILEVINEYFQEGADVLYADALLLEDDTRIKDAIAECLREEEPEPVEVRTKRRKIGKNYYGNWVGFEGKSKVRDFGLSEEAANQWLWGI